MHAIQLFDLSGYVLLFELVAVLVVHFFVATSPCHEG